MLTLKRIEFLDSDVEDISSQAQLMFFHQDEDVSSIAQFHVGLDMTREEFQNKTINELIEESKPFIRSKLQRTII